MKKENKVVIKKDCHSREPLSGIYNACCYYNKEKTLLNKCVEDPRLRHSGMTPLLTAARGFTLIELLVVVLIIGILAAVALPQYQKAVYKSRYATLKNLSESLAAAETVYYLANGAYTEDLEKLDVELSGGQLDDSTPKKYVWDWGYCISFLATDMTDKINVHCINEDINMGYVKTLTPAQTNTSCYVYGVRDPADFPLQNDICKSETGLSERTSGASNTLVGDYVRYQY